MWTTGWKQSSRDAQRHTAPRLLQYSMQLDNLPLQWFLYTSIQEKTTQQRRKIKRDREVSSTYPKCGELGEEGTRKVELLQNGTRGASSPQQAASSIGGRSPHLGDSTAS